MSVASDDTQEGAEEEAMSCMTMAFSCTKKAIGIGMMADMLREDGEDDDNDWVDDDAEAEGFVVEEEEEEVAVAGSPAQAVAARLGACDAPPAPGPAAEPPAEDA